MLIRKMTIDDYDALQAFIGRFISGSEGSTGTVRLARRERLFEALCNETFHPFVGIRFGSTIEVAGRLLVMPSYLEDQYAECSWQMESGMNENYVRMILVYTITIAQQLHCSSLEIVLPEDDCVRAILEEMGCRLVDSTSSGSSIFRRRVP